eukprot:CAMPEP_0113908212 /NCGR_PEP_ID=MMETSP0780_2-20120614/26011_1 /TAXON_ID=652834 /ORGANISM="Palpitomonas bilix" /LENGTH=316 /DNA_ID=CAMNT_0000903565 /DNA_START=71 /DNA_END=1021 /DNA_ORIENTATION=- /assembly_acc=CAM_ASM_000599
MTSGSDTTLPAIGKSGILRLGVMPCVQDDPHVLQLRQMESLSLYERGSQKSPDMEDLKELSLALPKSLRGRQAKRRRAKRHRLIHRLREKAEKKERDKWTGQRSTDHKTQVRCVRAPPVWVKLHTLLQENESGLVTVDSIAKSLSSAGLAVNEQELWVAFGEFPHVSADILYDKRGPLQNCFQGQLSLSLICEHLERKKVMEDVMLGKERRRRGSAEETEDALSGRLYVSLQERWNLVKAPRNPLSENSASPFAPFRRTSSKPASLSSAPTRRLPLPRIRSEAALPTRSPFDEKEGSKLPVLPSIQQGSEGSDVDK